MQDYWSIQLASPGLCHSSPRPAAQSRQLLQLSKAAVVRDAGGDGGPVGVGVPGEARQPGPQHDRHRQRLQVRDSSEYCLLSASAHYTSHPANQDVNLNAVNCEQRSVVCLHPDVRVGELESGAGETGGRPSPPPARPRSAGSAGQVITLPHCVYPSLYSKLCCTGTAAKVPPSCTFSSNTLLLLNTSNRKFCIVPFCDYSQNQKKCSYLFRITQNCVTWQEMSSSFLPLTIYVTQLSCELKSN